MSIYRFVLRSGSGQVEELGCLPLPDDREAVAFGKLVVEDMIQDLVQGTLPPHAPVMEVIDGERTVGRIGPSNSDIPSGSQQKVRYLS
jgi:hypothetical protein